MVASESVNLNGTTDLLKSWLARQVSAEGLNWLEGKREQIASGAAERVFFTSFSAVPRYIGKADLQLSPEDLDAAHTHRRGWSPAHWSADQVGRTLLVLALPHGDRDAYLDTLNKVFTAADVGESVALYQSLPLLPLPELHRSRASEGIRSNMTGTFNAVALRNPYPADYFDDAAWNQMVLKAIFVGSPLYLIRGLDERANPKLARMLSDYAHERWAAKRPVTPELWRAMGSHVEGHILSDLERVLKDSDPVGREAAALACFASDRTEARTLLDNDPELKSKLESGALTWETFTKNRLRTAR